MRQADSVSRVFGQNLRDYRKKRRPEMTTYEMANHLRVSVQTLSAYERGDRVPPMSVLDRLHKEFDVAPEVWLVPDGPLGEGDVIQPRARQDAVSQPMSLSRPGPWADDIWYLSQVIPQEAIAKRLAQLEEAGLKPGCRDVLQTARQAGMNVEEAEGEWHPGMRAAYLSADPAEVSILHVHSDAEPSAKHEDAARALVTWVLALPGGACRTWADSETRITRWHPAGSQLFGYGLEPDEWNWLRIDSFAQHPSEDTNHCGAYEVVRALLTEEPDDRQRRIGACTSFPLLRVERLYHKDGSSFVAGITVDEDKDGPDETRLLVTVTNLEVPALIERLAREVTVPTGLLRRMLVRGGASTRVLGRVFNVQEATIRARMHESGLWNAVYNGVECLSPGRSQRAAEAAPERNGPRLRRSAARG